MEWLENFFEWVGDAIDADSDSVVDLNDAEEMANNAAEAVANFADQNDSGSIEFNDLTTAVFSFIDKNGSGKLESEDFQKMLLGFVDKNGDGQFTSIDRVIWKLGAEIGENFGPVSKIAFLNAAKHLL